MPNHAGVLQRRFFPANLETEGDDAIFNTLLGRGVSLRKLCFVGHNEDGTGCCSKAVLGALRPLTPQKRSV